MRTLSSFVKKNEFYSIKTVCEESETTLYIQAVTSFKTTKASIDE